MSSTSLERISEELSVGQNSHEDFLSEIIVSRSETILIARKKM